MNFLLEMDDKEIHIVYTEGEQRIDDGSTVLLLYGMADDVSKFLSDDSKERISGSYTVIKRTKKSAVWRIFPGEMGGNKTIYYLKKDDKIYVFTSLKFLSKISYPCSFHDDHELICEFLYNGFIRTKDTLVRDVYKLLPDEYMEMEPGRFAVKKSERMRADASDVSCAEMYAAEKEIIDAYIDLALSQSEKPSAAVSGGYDSNWILHFLKERKIPFSAFSVGGARGLDETAAAEKICSRIPDVHFVKGKVSADTLEHYEDIVRILEGNLYERGVFLQYSLAKLLREHEVSHVLLGECADQVFNRNYYDCKEPGYLTNYTDDPYELGCMVVYKKSVLMLDAFGVTGIYPFTDRRMQELGAKLCQANGTSKIMQKQMCREYFDEYTNRLVDKSPGSTSLQALFRNTQEENDFIRRVQQTNEFYDPEFRISYKYGPFESELDYYLCLEYLRIFKSLFCG